MKRSSGVLLAISSIPSKYGIGGFSKEAYKFVDFLEKGGQSLWQILPLGPTGFGDSPYQSFSTFAGNPYYIDLEEFIEKGWLTEAECIDNEYDNSEYVNYERIFKTRFALLKKAFSKSNIAENGDFVSFFEENKYWLDSYALYMSIKDSKKGQSWNEWEEDIKLRKKSALEKYRKELKNDYDFYCFQQYFFCKQWFALKEYANAKGIKIVGDIPIYVAMDSADTWSNPKLFKLDKNCNPTVVAGCPPDAFTALGQLWGNPIYDWDYHKKTDYEWWMLRIAHCYKLYDVVRIDHFRGFDEYYTIEFGRENAKEGKWLPGPGYDLFRAMKEKIGNKPVIAEDLGFLTDSVVKLVKKTKYPGMKILQFAFDSREESDYLPYNYERNCVVYTGTHDNDTVMGWYSSLTDADKDFAKRYMDLDGSNDVCDKIIRLALGSVADTAIIPMQDYLELGGEARMNVPSTLGTNWKWRMKECAMTEELAEKMYKYTRMYGRLH